MRSNPVLILSPFTVKVMVHKMISSEELRSRLCQNGRWHFTQKLCCMHTEHFASFRNAIRKMKSVARLLNAASEDILKTFFICENPQCQKSSKWSGPLDYRWLKLFIALPLVKQREPVLS